MERWCGRVAVVTGASAGLGRDIAVTLAKQGLRVVALARRVENIQVIAAELQQTKGELHAVQCDITKENDIIRVVQWTRDNLGGIDVLVNNAGVLFQSSLVDADMVKLRSMLDTNILGLCMFTREVLKCMKDRGVDDGHIININGAAGHQIITFPGSHFYSGTKHAVRVLSEGLRRELRDLKSRTRITELSPGLMRTELTRMSGMSIEEVEQRYSTLPWLRPRDVTDALIFALAAPPHVQIHEIIMYPIDQPQTEAED